jgi:hypothetical protein
MGLDTVELLMAVEDTFGIEIPNAEADTIVTVDDLFRAVLAHLPSSDRPDSVVWDQLRRIIVEECAVRPELITPDAAIVADLGIN